MGPRPTTLQQGGEGRLGVPHARRSPLAQSGKERNTDLSPLPKPFLDHSWVLVRVVEGSRLHLSNDALRCDGVTQSLLPTRNTFNGGAENGNSRVGRKVSLPVALPGLLSVPKRNGLPDVLV